MRNTRLLSEETVGITHGVPASVVIVTACALALQPAPASAQQSTESYAYDALGRLIKVEVAGGQNEDEVHSLCYDPAGNRTAYEARSDGSEAACADTGSSGPQSPPPSLPPTPPPPPPPPASTVVLTDPGLAVLTAHQTTYDCALIDLPAWGIYTGSCWLKSNQVTVYETEEGNHGFDPGYSLQSLGVFQVGDTGYDCPAQQGSASPHVIVQWAKVESVCDHPAISLAQVTNLP